MVRTLVANKQILCVLATRLGIDIVVAALLTVQSLIRLFTVRFMILSLKHDRLQEE